MIGWWRETVASSEGASISTGDAEREVREAFARGDLEEVLSLLMRDHGRSIYRFCCQMVGDNLGDDVHQMTFVQAFEALPRFRGRSSFRTWLFGIARHRCLDAVKAGHRRRRRFEPLADSDPHIDPRALAAEDLLARERERHLAECIEALQPEMRETVLLRFQNELSYDEIAVVLGERAPSLRVRVARALPRLRACLEEKGVAP